jgi:hypothetical protein
MVLFGLFPKKESSCKSPLRRKESSERRWTRQQRWSRSEYEPVVSKLFQAQLMSSQLDRLLDLKHKQASSEQSQGLQRLNADNLRLVEEADKRAKEGEKQSAYLLVFTVISVIFVSLRLRCVSS